MDDYTYLPFHVLRVPDLQLRLPKVQKPPPMLLFVLVFISFFLIFSGIIYDIIIEPPSIGTSRDEKTGAVKPMAFMQYRINGQFIIEGLSAGFLFVLGAVGFILLDLGNSEKLQARDRYLILVGGVVCIIVAYNVGLVFLRIKVPGYLKFEQ